MAHVVAEPCVGCKDTDCVTVCPVDCFHEGSQMLYIHPDQCIDCEACVPACPADAIYREDMLPIEWRPFIDLNATMANQSIQKRPENRRWIAKHTRPESEAVLEPVLGRERTQETSRT